MKINVSFTTRKKLFDVLKKEPNTFGDQGDREGILNFIEKIWDIDALPSTDERTLYNRDFRIDVFQHMVNNLDWDYDELFINKRNLLNDEKKFILFLETILSPEIRTDADETRHFSNLINTYLQPEGYRFAIETYNGRDQPIYSLYEYSKIEGIPDDITPNSIPFYVESIDAPYYRAYDYEDSRHPDNQYFVLIHTTFDDFNFQSTFHLQFYDSNNQKHEIGPVRIMRDDNQYNSLFSIDGKFTQLNDEFCSLGSTKDYYENVKQLFGDISKSILFALRDAAYFPQIEDEFDNKKQFKDSIIRPNDAERNLREARFFLLDYNLDNPYSFSYSFTPKYTRDPIEIDFNFTVDSDLPSRIIAFIGKNGAGKTQLITSLPSDINRNKTDKFKPDLPGFSKLIAVSYSIFDGFEIPKKNAEFNYVYCGLRNQEGDILRTTDQKNRFHRSRRKIDDLRRVNKWKKVLGKFLDQEILDSFFEEDDGIDELFTNSPYSTSTESFNRVDGKLSSGESILLYIITEIVANIRFDSLILFDEPETHLHPNAISQLVNTIYELVEEFESYCVLTTHSPLVIREIPSKDVFVIEREENTPMVRRIGLESFGENLSVLTNEVFGNRVIPKKFEEIIQEMVDEGREADEIFDLLEFDNVPLSLNTKMYIMSLIKIRDEES